MIPRDAVHQTSLGYNLNQPLEWSERSPSPLSEDNTGFLAYLQHAFPDGTNEFDLPLDHNEDISLWSPSLGQQGDDLYSQAFPVVRSELPRHTLEELTQEQPAITSQQEQETCPSPPRGLSLEFHGFSHETRQLLHHYGTHVCQLMMPTEAPSHNPWLQLYLPIAVQEPTSAAKQALLHSILAVSAFNQAGLRRSKGQPFRAQATEHSKKAARLLCSGDFTAEQSRGNEVDSTNKKALLAAALTMTTIEVSATPALEGFMLIDLNRSLVARKMEDGTSICEQPRTLSNAPEVVNGGFQNPQEQHYFRSSGVCA